MVPLTFLHGFLGAGTPTPRATPSRNPVPSRRSRHHRMSIQPARRHTRSRITTPATPSPVLEAGELGADRMGWGCAGKTTLLRHWLQNNVGERIGVVVNDMAEVHSPSAA